MAKKPTAAKKTVAKKTVVKKSTVKAPTAAAADAKPSRYVGATSGLRVKEFQNKTLADNVKAKLTDAQLAKLWREEFPKAASFDEKMVASVRAAYNRGAHGNEAPEKKIPAFDETGTALAIRGEKSAAKAAAKTAAAEPKTGKVLKLKKRATA